MNKTTMSSTGATQGRGRRSAAQWAMLVEDFARSELTQVAFCAREGISPMSLSNWRRRLANQNAGDDGSPAHTSSLPFIEMTSSTMPISTSTTVRLELGAGIVLTLTRGR